jgi:hypothetical protein
LDFEVKTKVFELKKIAQHLGFRLLFLPISFILVFIFSSLLGPERRGVVVGLLIITMISSVAVEKGFTVSIRLGTILVTNRREFITILRLTIIATFITQTIFLFIFYFLTNYFNPILYTLALLLSLFQNTQYFINNFLFTQNNHSKSALLELISVILQLLVFTLLTYSPVSTATSIFIAFSLASLITIFLSAKILSSLEVIRNKQGGLDDFRPLPWNSIVWSLAANIYAHLDKLLIVVVLGFGDLAKLTLCTAYFVIIRSVGEVSNKFLTLRRSFFGGTLFMNSIYVMFPLMFVGTLLAQPHLQITKRILGEVWILPLTVVLLSLFNEVLRIAISAVSILLISTFAQTKASQIQLLGIVITILITAVWNFFDYIEGISTILLISGFINILTFFLASATLRKYARESN